MKINILAVGKIKDNNLKSLINEYIKRLSSYAQINIIEVEDEASDDSKASDAIIEKIKNIEGEKLLKKLNNKSYVITLDLNKEIPNTLSFAKFLENSINNYSNNIYFVIGGSYGLGDNIKARANYSISLSNLTFTHQMTRLILLEQIYRAFKINNNEVYHK